MALIRFHLVTLFPEIFSALHYGVVGRAQQADLIKLIFWNPRNYADNKQGRIDDTPYGGGPGMVMQAPPLRRAIQAAKKNCKIPDKCKTIYLSPQGKLLTQPQIQQFLEPADLILVAGRYAGIDERIIQKDIDEEWSIGDYILSGGEMPAMVLIDAVTRLLPGVLGDPASPEQDSFSGQAGLLDYPRYTRPQTIDGQTVPAVLLSGNHEAIRRFRLQHALGNTWLKKPDLLKNRSLNAEEQLLLQNFINK